MKKLLLLARNTFLAVLVFGLSGGTAFAISSSVDRITDHIEPLIKSDFVRGQYFVATSTTATSTFAGGINITGGGLKIGSLSGILKATSGVVNTALVSLTSDVTGTLPVANGGTGATSISTPTVTAPITYSGTLGSFIGGVAGAFDCTTATGSVKGCLSAADFTTFNGKQAAGNYITALTGDVTATGPGSVAATLATVNGNVGSFTNGNFTVDAKGRITAASNGASGSGGSIGTSTPLVNGQVDFSTSANTIANSANFLFDSVLNKLTVTNASTTNLTIGSLSGILKQTGGVVLAAVAGTDYENPLTFVYPLVRTTNSISTAFGTTTSNTFAGTQTFTNSPVFSTVGAGTVNSTAAGTLYNTATSSVSSGTGISFTGTAGALVGGTSLTITNSGVTSNVAGTGISVSGATGAVTIGNTGVISLGNGTGTTCSGTNPGTCNVNTTQNILKISGLTTNGFVQTSGSDGTLSSAALTSGQVTTALGFTPFGGTNPLPIANGGTATTTYYNKGLVFFDGTRLTQPAGSGLSILNWDNTNGFLGIGTTTPYGELSLNAPAGNAPYLVIGSSTEVMKIAPSPTTLVGVATSSPWRTLAVTGTVGFDGLTASAGLQAGILCLSANKEVINESIQCISSAKRYKENINNLPVGLDELMKLRPVSFTWKKSYNGALQSDPNYSGTQYSLVADEVQKVDPNLVIVTTASSTFEGKNYPAGTVQGLADVNHWVALLVKSIQEIATKQDSQQAQIDELKGEVQALKTGQQVEMRCSL
jgi:hypothetical protein